MTTNPADMPKRLKSLNLPSKIAIGMAVVLSVSAGTGAVGAASLASGYKDRILPGVSAGGVDLSGMDHLAAAQALNSAFDSYIAEGFAFTADGQGVRIDPATDLSDSSRGILMLDTDGTVARALAVGHGRGGLADGVAVAYSLVRHRDLPLSVSVDAPTLEDALRSKIGHLETAVTEPTLSWDGKAMAASAGRDGKVFDVEAAVKEFADRAAMLSTNPVAMTSRDAAPGVGDSEAQALAAKATKLLETVPLTLTYGEDSWSPSTSTVASWLKAGRQDDGTLALAVDQDALGKYLDTFRDKIEVAPQDARFEMKDGRAVEFQASQDGVAIDVPALAAAIAKDWAGSGQTAIAIPVTQQKSTVTTANVNDLGIKEILGQGVSTYYGSHANRIKNIKNALTKLNGLLIPPDGEFSLIAALEPFTAEGGWLPEKVIKGDEIKSEIGGGACQIGTTTFRAAMMSGLPILERQNHSLVVSYYNDPANGNPGTDATIYDPSPDFRFKNDTGHYILFETSIDEAKQKLTFTFWGTSDGRKGSYTPPVVSKWYPPGPAEDILTTDLAPGTKDCQGAFKGADTSFTYTVSKADGTSESKVFTSHYRPLGAICMVGATAAEVAAGKLDPVSSATSTASAAD